MKTIILLFFFLFPLLSFAQVSHQDSIEIKKIGVWNPIDYPNASVHSMWIDCANPLLFVNDKIDFTQMEYIITGGTYEQGEKKNQINLIPFENMVSIQLIYKGVYVQKFEYRTLKLIKPELLMIKQNGDTLTDDIRLGEISKLKAFVSTDDRLSRDLIKLPISKLKNITYFLTRENKSKPGRKTTVVNTYKLVELQKQAKKNDDLVIEATLSTSRYSYILKKQIEEEHKVVRSYQLK